MTLKEIYDSAKTLNYHDFENSFIFKMTGKTYEGSNPLAETDEKTKATIIIASRKALNYAKEKHGVEYYDESSLKVKNSLTDYSKGFIDGTRYAIDNRK